MSNAKIRSYIRRRVSVKLSGCWEWLLARDKDGYGKATIGGKTIKAHRLSFAAFVGDLDEDEQALHRCDNPPCVNPDHLFSGSNQDNVDDKNRKNRQYQGEKHHNAKLSVKAVQEIRRLLSEEVLSQTEIAYFYRVSQFVISQVGLGKIWKHVPAAVMTVAAK